MTKYEDDELNQKCIFLTIKNIGVTFIEDINEYSKTVIEDN